MDTVPPVYALSDFFFRDFEDDAILTVVSQGRRFHIVMSGDTFKDSPSIQEKYRYYLKVAECRGLDDCTEEEFYDWILEPFIPIFKELPALGHKLTLQDYYFGETFFYTLRIVGESLVPQAMSSCESPPIEVGVFLSENDYAGWRIFTPQQVDISLEDLVGAPTKVVIDHNVFCFFKNYMPGSTKTVRQELQNHTRIKQANIEKDIRISCLHGIVRDSTGLIMGLLLSYIHCNGVTLRSENAHRRAPRALRQRWAHQIVRSLKRLHEAGVVWGDAKTENILIDKQKNAWIIDFGGGFTEGYVDKELAGTIEGDLQVLSKILEFLSIGETDECLQSNFTI